MGSNSGAGCPLLYHTWVSKVSRISGVKDRYGLLELLAEASGVQTDLFTYPRLRVIFDCEDVRVGLSAAHGAIAGSTTF